MKRANTSRDKKPTKRARINQSQVAMTQNIVRRELRRNTDWRYTDVSAAALAVYSTPQIVSLYSNLVRGDSGLNNFQGNVVKPQAITMKYYADTAQVFNVLRVMVFQWFDSVTPALTGILQSGTTGIALCSPVNITNKQYIKVLYDKTHMLAPTAGDAAVIGNGTIDPVTVYIPGKRLRTTRFNATTAVVQDGNIYVMFLSDDAALGTVNVTYHTRVTLKDE